MPALEVEVKGASLFKTGFREYVTPVGEHPRIYRREMAGGTITPIDPPSSVLIPSGAQVFSLDNGDPSGQFDQTLSGDVARYSDPNNAIAWLADPPAVMTRLSAIWDEIRKIGSATVHDQQTLALSDEYTTDMMVAGVDFIYDTLELDAGDPTSVASRQMAPDETFFSKSSGRIRVVIDLSVPSDGTPAEVSLIRTATDLDTGESVETTRTVSIDLPEGGSLYGVGDWIEEGVPSGNKRIAYKVAGPLSDLGPYHLFETTFQYLGP